MIRLLSRVRFLPITIFAATLMLTVKVSDILDGVDNVLSGVVTGSPALAQQTEEQPAAEEEGEPEDGEDAPPEEADVEDISEDPALALDARAQEEAARARRTRTELVREDT